MQLKLVKQIICLTVFCIASMLPALSFAQQHNSEQIKSAYLFNFLKHVNWPQEHLKTSFTIAIYQDKAFYQLTSQALNNRQVKGKPISVVLVNNTTEASKADLVFTLLKEKLDITQLASALRGTNTLLVTDNSIDKHNIMINLIYNSASSAISFEVNKSNIIYEKLTVTKVLLLLGGTEIDIATLYRETELAMQKMRLRESALNQELLSQQSKVSQSTERLEKLNIDLVTRTNIAEQRQQELELLKKDIENQKSAINAKEQQLVQLVEQLSVAKGDLNEQQLAVSKKEDENRVMADRINANKNILEQQTQEIAQHAQQLDLKNEQLAEGKELIDQQQFYLMLLAVLFIAVITFLLLVIWLFSNNKKTTKKLKVTLENLQNMQEQLIQSEKLASLGKLTAGVAHEINTPLGIAVTSTSSALENTKDIKVDFENNTLTKSAMVKYFRAMEQAAQLNTSSLERVIELLNNFKQVAADQVVGEIREIDLVDYINEIISTLSAEMKRFRVEYHYSGVKDVHISTIPGALAQIITNLVTNSLRHGFENSSSGNITIEIYAEQSNVSLIYKDDGHGMSQEVLQNIFEPFFTTKRHTGGTGLGMNIVYNIICQKLQGNITIDSKPDHGASFHITLPYKLTE